MSTQIIKENILSLEKEYTDSLKNKIDGKIFNPSTNIQLVNLIGNEFVRLVGTKFQLQNFSMRQSKTMNILLFSIVSSENKLAEIAISTKEESENNLLVTDVMVSFFLEELLNDLE